MNWKYYELTLISSTANMNLITCVSFLVMIITSNAVDLEHGFITQLNDKFITLNRDSCLIHARDLRPRPASGGNVKERLTSRQ